MAQILVRGLDERTVALLKERASRSNRSLQGEVKAILEEAAESLERQRRFRDEVAAWQKEHNTGRMATPSSVEILRELRGED
jgi:plasmid stability protein